MTNEQREHAISRLAMDCVELECAYRELSRALGAFGSRLHRARPDACEAFFERAREQLARAEAEFDRIEQETFEANIGITNDGPDRWTADLDRLNAGKAPK